MDAPLFARSVKGVVPTEIGPAPLRRTHLLFNEVRRTKDEIAQLRDGTGGRLCVAFSSATTQSPPQALMDFRRQRPRVSLEPPDARSAGRSGRGLKNDRQGLYRAKSSTSVKQPTSRLEPVA